MASVKQTRVRRPKMAERAQMQLDQLFPDYPKEWLWLRKENDGYSTVPRTLPIAMQAIDNQTKGKPAGHTLLCLWIRSPDHPLVTIENPAVFAAEAGFQGERAVHTWRQRMKSLTELGFIQPRKGSYGDYHYVLLLNPNAAVEWMRSQGKVQDALYHRFHERVVDIGAYSDIERIRVYWQKKKIKEDAKAKAKAKKSAAEKEEPKKSPG